MPYVSRSDGPQIADDRDIAVVDTKAMTEVATQGLQKTEEFAEIIRLMKSMMAKSNEVWVGTAGDTFRDAFDKEVRMLEMYFDEYRKYIDDLMDYVAFYEDVDKVTLKIAADLGQIKWAEVS